MRKHSIEFKLAVVHHYMDGPDGYKAVAKHHGVCHTMVREWVGAFQHHGEAGLRPKSSRAYTAEFKLSVLRHMWDQKLTYSKAAAVFDIRNHGDVSAWERSYYDGGVEALAPRTAAKMKKMTEPVTPETRSPEDANLSKEQLLKELQRLRMENAYLKKLRALVQVNDLKAQQKKRK